MTEPITQSRPLVAIDWGTTNRRLFLMDKDGECHDEQADGWGVATLGKAALAREVDALRTRYAGHDLLMAGMVGSSIGWREVAYIPCPVNLGGLATALYRSGDGQGCIRLVPGVRTAPDDVPDVMRGEEIQLLGAVEAGLVPPDCTICHPGTHAKWVRLRGYAIQRFRTVMTGEIFALLKSGSILAPALVGKVEPNGAFLAGVAQGLASSALAADLFSIRARLLLETLAAEDAAAFCSGLLIGNDIRFGLDAIGRDPPLALIGDPGLTALYAAALRVTGQSAIEVDGRAAFIAGARALAGR
ncbi:MAG: 2-dehydro-3-deoxygalactonokinase [Chakrabartia sp.]